MPFAPSHPIALLDAAESRATVRLKRFFVPAISAALGLVTLYVFVHVLPQRYLPEATNLHPISSLRQLDRTFAVLDPSKVGPFGATNSFHPLKKSEMERLIIIGDIHGSYNELKKLLRKVKYRQGRDHILALGDFITKGPDSFKVLNFLMENNAACILGNHEYSVLEYYAKFRRMKKPTFTSQASALDDDDLSADLLLKPVKELLLAEKLEPKHVQYINNCPVILELGPVPIYSKSKNDVTKGVWSEASVAGVAVHAGLELNKSLQEQAPLNNIEMRAYIKPDYTKVTSDSDEPNAVSWSKVFNAKQKEKGLDQAIAVYYGHDAKRSLNLKRFTKGLDTRCVKGGQLLAMILWKQTGKKSGKIKHFEQLVSVDC